MFGILFSFLDVPRLIYQPTDGSITGYNITTVADQCTDAEKSEIRDDINDHIQGLFFLFLLYIVDTLSILFISYSRFLSSSLNLLLIN